MSASETQRHRDLKRLALRWAQDHGFTIAAAEVSVPRLGCCRLDVAAFRPEPNPEAPGRGIVAVFECKQSRADFLRDARCEAETLARLEILAARRRTYEDFLRAHHPTLRLGDELFPEFEAHRFDRLGYEPYDSLLAEIAALTRRLHSCTKFSRLARWQAAHLHYVVAEPEVARPAELPAGWGLLLRGEVGLATTVQPTWYDIPPANCWNLVLRIAKCGTRALVRSLEPQTSPHAVHPAPRGAL